MSEIPSHILEWRRRTGADRLDEVWDGVLHMVPSPSSEHQWLELRLAAWLLQHWASSGARKVLPRFNVARSGIPDWTKDFRVPDLLLIAEHTAARDRSAFFDGGPDAVVEIRSPGDETYEKLRFYAAVGCREIWIVDRDSCACELWANENGEPVRQKADADGWLHSALGVELRTEDRRLALRLRGDAESRGLVP